MWRILILRLGGEREREREREKGRKRDAKTDKTKKGRGIQSDTEERSCETKSVSTPHCPSTRCVVIS